MNRFIVPLLSCALFCSAAVGAGEVEDLLALAQQGDGKALVALRMKLSAGRDSAAQVEQVVDGFRQAAIKGDVEAQFEFAFLLEHGLGLPRDYGQAERWYLKAAERGHVDSQYRLGRMYHEGEAVGTDRKQGFVWLAIAAAGGSQKAAVLRDRAADRLAPGDLEKAKAEAKAVAKRIARP